MEIDINLEAIDRKTGIDGARRKTGSHSELLGFLVALGAGIAFGALLALCFVGVASVAILASAFSNRRASVSISPNTN